MAKWINCILIILAVGPAAGPVLLASPMGNGSPEEAVARAMSGPLQGFTFNKRLGTGNDYDHVLLFQRENEVRLAVWTTAPDPAGRFATVPASNDTFALLDADGNTHGSLQVRDFVLAFPLQAEPRFLVPPQANDFLLIGAMAERLPTTMRVLGPRTVDISVSFVNPFDSDILFVSSDPPNQAVLRPGGSHTVRKTVDVGRSLKPVRASIEGMGFIQDVLIYADNPIYTRMWPRRPEALTLDVINPTGNALRGWVELRPVTREDMDPVTFPINFANQERVKRLDIPFNFGSVLPFPLQVAVMQRLQTEINKVFTLTETDPLQFMAAADFLESDGHGAPVGYGAKAEGRVVWSLQVGGPRQGMPFPQRGSVLFIYAFKPGSTSVGIEPRNPALRAIAGVPSGVGFWLYGDATGHAVSVRIRDADGQVFQPEPVIMDWDGWRYVTLDFSGNMREPLEWDALLHIENTGETKEGGVFFNAPILKYELSAMRR